MIIVMTPAYHMTMMRAEITHAHAEGLTHVHLLIAMNTEPVITGLINTQIEELINSDLA